MADRLHCSAPPCPRHPQIYAGPLSGGARAVVLANFQTTQSQYPISNITVYWEQLGLRPDVHAQVRDLYARRDLGVFVGAFQAAVAVHDVAMVRITPDNWVTVPAAAKTANGEAAMARPIDRLTKTRRERFMSIPYSINMPTW